MSDGLIIRDVEIEGRTGLDVRLLGGVVTAVGAKLPGGGPELDGKGGALIPGLIDHHIHLMATAARADSLRLDDVRDAAQLAARLATYASVRPRGQWLRATGYHERMAGLLGRDDLDVLAPRHPVRIQHQTGSLWILNSAALALILADEAPDCVERDAGGRPTGRIWRGDAWLRTRIGRTIPALAPVGAQLARLGVTGLTDASASTDAAGADALGRAARVGDLPQRLTLMSARALASPSDGAFRVGPVKILLDDHDLPPFDAMTARIAWARSQNRTVAVHCVAAGELALTLAAFETAGSRPGDRIEHGGVIPPEAIPVIVRLGLTVVTQSGFVFERGDRYLDAVPADEHDDLYRCASLRAAGVPVAASSDAPYASPDPWAAMRAATRRKTRSGRPIGESERVTADVALAMYLGDFDNPGGPPRRVAVGAPADLVLLAPPIREALDALTSDLVRATLIGGRLAAAPTF